LLSLVSFLCGAALLGVMIWKAEKLVRLGLAGNLYYVVLLPLGLAAAVFLFGVLQSYARYSGKVLDGALELGGPVVVFALVVIGGFVLVPNPSAFSVTVYVHGEAGTHDVVLRNVGFVVMDLGPDRRREAIGDKGQAYFPSIPASFRGQEAPVWAEAEGFEPVNPGRKQRLDSSSLYLCVRRKAARLTGRVQDESGRPVAGAGVRVGGISASTDASGHFGLNLPGDQAQGGLSLQVTAPGYQPWREQVVPNANEVVVILHRAP
jgi:hypothetical protein